MPLLAFLFRMFVAVFVLVGVPTASVSSVAVWGLQDAPPPDWPMYLGGPERNGATAATGPMESTVAASVVRSTNAPITSSPAVADGVLYFGSEDGYVWAIDAASGELRWQYATGGPVTSSPAVDLTNQTLYIGTVKGLLALNNLDGTLKWLVPVTNGVTTSPAVYDDGLVYFVGGDGMLGVYDAAQTYRWSASIGGAIYSSPAVSEFYIFVGAPDGLHILIRSTPADEGRPNFNTGPVVPTDAPVNGTPVVSGDRVYFTTTAGTAMAIDLNAIAQGGPLESCWDYAFGSSIGPSPAVVDRSVLVTDGQSVWRLSTRDGACGGRAEAEELGPYDLGETSQSKRLSQSQLLAEAGTGFAIADNGLFFGDGNHVYGIDKATGQTRWSVPLGGEVLSAPSVANGVVYVGSTDGTIYKLAAADAGTPAA